MPHPAVRFIAPAACVSVRPPRNLGLCSLRKPPCSDPGLRRDVRISSSSGSVRRASLTHRALFQMAPKWLAKTKYGAKPKPKATAPPPSPSPSPSRAPKALHSAPVPALAPADRGAPHSAPKNAPATQPRAPEAPQSAPVPAPAPADRGAPHSAPKKAPATQPRAPEAPQSAPVRPWRRPTGARRTLPPQRQQHLNRAPQRRCTPPLSRPWRRLTGARHHLPPHRQRPSHHPAVWISS